MDDILNLYIDVIKITEPEDFWIIFDQLISFKYYFINVYRDFILSSYEKGILYGINIETNELYEDIVYRRKLANLTHSTVKRIMVPGFCIVEDNNCKKIWIAPEFRNFGFGRFFIEELNITSAKFTRDSKSFWEHMNIKNYKFSSDCKDFDVVFFGDEKMSKNVTHFSHKN